MWSDSKDKNDDALKSWNVDVFVQVVKEMVSFSLESDTRWRCSTFCELFLHILSVIVASHES